MWRPRVQSNWKNCGVANAVAQQFARALATLGELDHYVNVGEVTFRVCDGETLDCNETPQPFPPSCRSRYDVSRRQQQRALVWSPNGVPAERKNPYALVMINETAHDVVFTWPMKYQFSGSPTGADSNPSGVLGGVSESRGDAPTIRVVVPKVDAHETKDSAILVGERSVEPQLP